MIIVAVPILLIIFSVWYCSFDSPKEQPKEEKSEQAGMSTPAKNSTSDAPKKEVRIDVAGISDTIPMKMGRSYSITLKNTDTIELKGEWKSNDFEISVQEDESGTKTKIKPQHNGDCIIEYRVAGEPIVSRTLKVVP